MTKMLFFTTLLLSACLGACSSSSVPSQARTEAFDHMAKAVALNNQATELENGEAPFTQMSQSNATELEQLWTSALKEARQVDIAQLNAAEPGFGNTFKAKFVHGLELCTAGLRDGDGRELIKGQLLLHQFGKALTAVKAKHR